jgi:hypothetical protein
MTIKVVALYADHAGCGDYRVRFPADAVNRRSEELGVSVEALDHLPGEALFDGVIADVRRVDVPSGVSVVSFQRPMKSIMTNAILWLRQHRPDVGIVVEIDDDLAAIPTNNTAYYSLNPKYSPGENTQWLAKAIQNCDVLTVSTPELARRYSGVSHQTMVVRNAVPVEMLAHPAATLSRKPSHKELNKNRLVGWAGYAGTHGGDLETTSGALTDVIDGNYVRFRNVGPRDGVATALGLNDDHVEASGWLSSDMYRIALSELDIGIVPLADTRFNRGKSALKALEMAAAGVPMIASKLPEFEALRREGMPIITVKDRRREWVLALERLLSMSDSQLRDLALQHREFIRRCATVDHRAHEWANAWTAAHRIASSRVSTRRVAV